MTEQTKPVGDVTVFATGGCGTNIMAPLENYRNHSERGLAQLNSVYIDTSTSNLKPHLPKEKIYIVKSDDSTDGSGKERKQNAEPIMKHSKDILLKHKPGYLTVIVTSLSGGSGAVIAASLANELLAQNKLVVVIAVGVADSGIEIENTKKSLATFEGLVKSNKKSLVVAYFENSKDTPASKVDDQVVELITALLVLFSRQNEGLDTRDLYNFINVDALTSHAPQVAGLETYAGKLVKEEHADTITVASAVLQQDNRGIDFILPYTTYGLMPNDIADELIRKEQIHLVTKAYPFNDIQRRLNGHLDDMANAAKANTAKSELLDADTELTGGFLSL